MRLQLSIEDKSDLHRIQRNLIGTPDHVCVTCILMFDNDTSPKFISANLDISPATIYRYVGEYQAGDIESWLESGNNGYWSMLSSHKTSVLRKELKKHVYMDAKSVSKWIRKTFGMPYTQGTIDLLNRIGFTYKKATEVPCEADASLQETFVAELTETLTQMEEGSVVYYADGVHPTHNSRSTYAWIEKGKQLEQPTVSGRDRINMNGLLNAHNVTDVIAHDCESVNAKSTRKLYESALAKHPDAPCIYIISDNAKYYHNKELKEWVEGTRIKQIFLPPYSPNLNLMERLWKFLWKKVINTGFYRTKEKFRKAVKQSFENIDDFREEFGVTSNFQFSIS